LRCWVEKERGGPSSFPSFLLLLSLVQTNLPNFRTQLYKNIQRSYVEFRLFADQLSVGNPQSESRFGSSELNGETKSSIDPPFLLCSTAIVSALPLPQSSAITDEEGKYPSAVSIIRPAVADSFDLAL